MSSIIAYRLLLKARARSAPVVARHSAIFKKAAAEEAKRKGELVISDIPDHVCKDCHFKDQAESQTFAWLNYFVEQFIIEYGVANIPYAGKYLSVFMMMMAAGNQVIDNTLSPTLCAKHREIYMREYMTFCLKEGMKVEAATQLTAQLISRLTGVSASWYIKEIRTLFTISEVERMQLQELPEPLTSSNGLSNPSMVIQAAVRGATKELVPMLVEKFKAIFSQPGESIDIVKLIKTIDHFHRKKSTQAALLMFLPHMLANPSNFVNDAVIKDYWQPIQEKLFHILNLIKAYHNEYTTGLKGKLVQGATSIAPNKSLELLSNYLGISQKVAEKLFDFARSEDYYKVDAFIRDALSNRLGIKKDLSFSDADREFIARQRAPEPEVNMTEPYAMLVTHTKNALIQYRKEDNSGQGFDFGLKQEGRRRADIYQNLLVLCSDISYKQFVCYCALINQSGGTLSQRLTQHTRLSGTSSHTELFNHIQSKLQCDGRASDLARLAKDINDFANSNPDSKGSALMSLCVQKEFIARLERAFPLEDSAALTVTARL